jgi:anti-sigma28 factor (negative regulator of flagellin synthesis)
MINNDIVNEIARLVAQRELTLKDPKETRELKSKKGISNPTDTVTFTSKAQSYASSGTEISSYEKEQNMKVERLKSLVSEGHYKMDDAMVSTIAERIANTLV